MIIISSKPGQLGNMLFLFAHFIAYGRENNVIIKAPAFNEYASYFETTHKTIVPSYPPTLSLVSSSWLRGTLYIICNYSARILYRLRINNRFVTSVFFDWQESLNLDDELKHPDSRYMFIRGWLIRAKSSFEKNKIFIREYFVPTTTYLQSIDHLLKVERDLLIGIHIRQGDYKHFEGGKFLYSVSQYKVLMQKTLQLFPNKRIIFLACSDGKLEKKEFDDLPVIFGTGKDIEDLYAFAKCNYLVGPPSTFTMWASFYGEVPLYMVHQPTRDFTISDFKIING